MISAIKLKKNIRIKSHLFMITLILISPLANLGTDIYTPSLPAIVTAMHTKVSLVKLTITVYLLAYGIGQIIFGIASDSLGRRKLLLTGMAGFALFFLLAGMVTNIYWFLFIRILQGLCAAITSVISKAIITDKYIRSRLQKASNGKVLAQIMSIILAPFIGGYIQYKFGWTWNFIFLSLYSTVILILVFLIMKETLKSKVVFSSRIVITNSKKVLQHKDYLLLTASLAILYSIVSLFGVFGSFLVQNIYSYNSIIYGFMMLSLGIFYMLGSILSKYINKVVFIYIFTVMLSSIILTIVGFAFIKPKLIFIFIPIIFIMFSCGIILPNRMSRALSLFKTLAGTASAFLGAFVMLGTGSIIGLTSFFHSDNCKPMVLFYVILSIISCLLIYSQTQASLKKNNQCY